MSRIIAIGGGGFVEPHQSLMHRYVLAQTERTRPKVCFVATGKGDAAPRLDDFHAVFGNYACEPTHLALFDRTVRDLERFIRAQDIVFVWGGNTASMLAVWHAHGLVEILRRAAQQGVVLAGVCAGALVWFEDGLTDSFGGLDALGGGLGLLCGSLCPHYDADPARRATYQRLIAAKKMSPGYAADVDVGLRFDDGQLTETVATREGAFAWEVRAHDGQPHEKRIVPRMLGELADS